LQFELFCLALFACFIFSWFTFVIKKDYVVFTDPETVPASTDFFASLIGSSESPEEE